MVRPRKRRFLRHQPNAFYFKPRGVPLRALEEIALSPEEWESLKLCDEEGLVQKKAAQKMGISQPTLQRTLSLARQKVAQALAQGMAIRIEKRANLQKNPHS